MTQTLSLTPPSEQILINQPILLTNISWKTYTSMVQDWQEKSGYHLTYNQGLLEIMPPLKIHEENKKIIGRFVETITEELEIEIYSLGSLTCQRKDLLRGFEPDQCYYLNNANEIWQKQKINLENDPPPDLIIEIDITSSSLKNLNLYADFKIPEIWLYNNQKIIFYRLENQNYVKSDYSVAFSFLKVDDLNYFLELRKTIKETSLIKQFRQWLKNKIT